jgi:hypothetical protein
LKRLFSRRVKERIFRFASKDSVPKVGNQAVLPSLNRTKFSIRGIFSKEKFAYLMPDQ